MECDPNRMHFRAIGDTNLVRISTKLHSFIVFLCQRKIVFGFGVIARQSLTKRGILVVRH